MSEDVMLQEAIDAIRQGQRARARDLLTRLLRTNQSNPDYWLWMSSVVDTQKEQVYCLQSVLNLDPTNSSAKQGLVLLGAMPPSAAIEPVPPIRRKWEIDVQEMPKQGGLKNPIVRGIFFTILGLVVIGLLVIGIYGLRARRPEIVAVFPTKTPGAPPTFTHTPTAINYTAEPDTPTPTYEGPPPLWMLLDATYTPTPLYVNTPHPASEAFRLAQLAYLRGDYDTALQNLRQATQFSPDAADVIYLMGEIYRARGEHQVALDAYEKAIEVNPDFAPAYLGRARAQLALEPKADIEEDLLMAIEKDPNYVEAHLEYAAYILEQGETETALEALQIVEDLNPDSPLLYLYRARANMNLDDAGAALEDAQLANELDRTLLPSYLLFGQASLLNGEYDQALEALEIYTTYEQEDPTAWTALGQALYETGHYSDTLTAMDRALELEEEIPEIYLYRGLVYLAIDHGQQAVNEIVVARRLDPTSFVISLNLGHALLSANRIREARDQFYYSEKLAETDEDLAAVYYWRAITHEAFDDGLAAAQDWEALLELPEKAVPQEWAETAEARLLATPTPTLTLTPTASPTETTTVTTESGTPTPASNQ